MHHIVQLPTMFFITHPTPTQFYTLSLHDALPIYLGVAHGGGGTVGHDGVELLELVRTGARPIVDRERVARHTLDRKSTRLNSSHQIISYAVFCLKKKKIVYNKVA